MVYTNGGVGPAPGSKAPSNVPSAFSRASPERTVAPTMVKTPPNTSFPSPCTTTLSTFAFGVPGLKVPVPSTLPFPLSRATLFRVAPSTVSKLPPITICPSPCTAIQYTNATLAVSLTPAPGSKVPSSVPSVSSRAIQYRSVPFTSVKLPPIRIFSSA